MNHSANAKDTIRNWLSAIVVTLLIISAAVTITLYFKPLYYMDIATFDLCEKYGVTEEEIRANYDALISYNVIFFDDPLEFPTLPMSENGRIHFEEVKNIFINLQWIGIVCLIFFTPILTNSRIKRNYEWLKYTAGLCIALPVLVGGFILIAWDKAFVLFHKLFFQNDYWIFDPATDPIIQFLPDGFFMHCAIMIVLLILAGAAVCIYYYRKTKTWFPKPGAAASK